MTPTLSESDQRSNLASIVVRSAEESDLPFIRDLFNHVIANTTAIYQEAPLSSQDINDWWEHKRSHSWPIFIGEINSKAVGFSTYGPFRARECYRPTVELAVHVTEQNRGNGVGKKLLAAVIHAAHGQGFHSMMAAIDSANAKSIHLHYNFGFKKAGELKQVAKKFGRWLDLTFMQLILSETIQQTLLPHISLERVHLRLPKTSDIPKIIGYFTENESHLSPLEPQRPEHFYTEAFWMERIPKHIEDFWADRAVRLFVFSHSSDALIGSLEFSQISRGPFQACYLGFSVGAKYQGQGFMYEALQGAIHFAFQDLHLHRIMANHLPENERSARLLSRLGFQREGLAKDYLRINGVWRDHVLNSLQNPAWRARQA